MTEKQYASGQPLKDGWPDNRGHQWRRDAHGDIDYLESGDRCGGPQCEACGYWFCQHCDEGPEEDCEP